MLDEFGDGVKWRAENGFKPGFFNAVEKALHHVLPGSNIKAQPNIESKVKNWKEKYGVLADVSRLSGFGWNYVTQSIEVDSEHVWAEYEKFHPKAKGMNGKAFPVYESWQVLFGKDRATGDLAEDPQDIDDLDIDVDDISIGTTNEYYSPRFSNGEFVHGGASYVDLGGGSETGNPSTPTSNVNTPTSIPPPKKPKKMTKAEVKQAALHESFGTYMNDTKEVMEKLVDAVGYDQKLSEKRERVFSELMKLELEMDDMFTANAMILDSEEKVDSFYGIPQELKQKWVERLLAGKIYPKTM